MEIEVVNIEKEPEHNVIIGQSHFIKTVEDIHEALVTTVPGIKFGLAFCEASGPRLIRHSGTDSKLEDLAVKNARAIGAGHLFVLFLGNAYPINILRKLKDVDEVVNIYAASANNMQVIVGITELGRAVLGVVDGEPPLGVEGEDDIKKRKEFLRKIGYKF